MPRIYFQNAPTGFQPVQGELITEVQQNLTTAGTYTSTIDGNFGNKTETALFLWQQQQGLPQTGKIDDQTWAALIKTAIPDIRQRALQVVATFEGTGFTKIEGNFDGAGLTWGIIGFTLSNGELAGLLKDINTQAPDVFSSSFGPLTTTITNVINSALSAQMDFANSISVGSAKVKVLPEWLDAFKKLGSNPVVQGIQMQRVDKYFNIAMHDMQTFNVENELGLALCFDIAVQNGGIDATEAALINNKIAKTPPVTQQDLRVIIANVIAENSKPRFIEDVRSRKLTFATGRGKVHGSNYDLKIWGLDELPV